MCATHPSADLYGASRMLLESVDAFLAQGWRVVACLPNEGPLADEIRAHGGEVRTVPSFLLRKAYLSPRRLPQLLWAAARFVPAGIRTFRAVRPDVLYVNTLIEPLWLVLGRCFRIPTLCHVHEGESSIPRAARRALASPLLLARRLIANSRFTMRVLTDTEPRLRARCVVVTNGVAGPPQVQPPRPTLTDPFRLLYVGRLSERKGVEDAIDAAQLLDLQGVDIRLDIVGSVLAGSEDFELELRRRVASAGLSARVHFLGFTPDIWSHLDAADAVLVPARKDESFGNSAVEAVLAARPVVVTRVGGLVEAIEGFDSAIGVAPESPPELAGALTRIRDEWGSFRSHAIRDAGAAADRHAPERYRTAVAEIVGALVP